MLFKIFEKYLFTDDAETALLQNMMKEATAIEQQLQQLIQVITVATADSGNYSGNS